MTGFSLKDHLFNKDKVQFLAGLFEKKVPSFSTQKFVAGVVKKLPDLELKQRIVHIAEVLGSHLPADYPTAAKLIIECLPPPLDESKTDDDFGDFIIAPLGEYVVKHGLLREHLSISFETLKELTKRFSMEDAMRSFIREYPQESVTVLKKWVQDKNYHVRRLVSESTRPLLPWSGRISLPRDVTLSLLSSLHADPTRYVTRSVANHLNDISKDDPGLVVETIQLWQSKAEQNAKELDWITRHSLRTAIKKGHAGALKLLGFHPNPKIELGSLNLVKSKIKAGESLQFSFDVKALRNESLVVDYVIEFIKSGGKRSSKVFKATTMQLNKGETKTVSKSHKLLAEATTYKLYPGEHRLMIQINGKSMISKPFDLTK